MKGRHPNWFFLHDIVGASGPYDKEVAGRRADRAMDKHARYNRSEKGKARYATYRSRHWMRVEEARLAWNETRRRRTLELHSQN